jgi:hypothetical protein
MIKIVVITIAMMRRCAKPRVTVPALVCVALMFLAGSVTAQQNPPNANPLTVRTQSLPKALVDTRFQYQLQAQGGNHPYHWTLVRGVLPKGIKLSWDGNLQGIPTEVGEFHFTVSAIDSSHPAMEYNQPLVWKISAPLLARWERYPTINGQRIEGSVKVSNDTDRDFDLTFITVAVNEIGRAQALGYQHFTLKKNTADFEIPFGENVPQGSYEIDADVVAEVAATHSIYRVHLVTKQRLVLQQGP